MTTITAKTILRSRNAANPEKVLSTLLLRYPRWIHAEDRTHRIISLNEALQFDEPTPSLMADRNLSRNAASSRAIPVEKLIADVLADPAIPLFWGKNQRGMQAVEECNEPVFIPDYTADPLIDGDGNHAVTAVSNREAWIAAMESAVQFARAFSNSGYHKQIVNRLLEPFSHITVLASATEWDNFLELRDHEDAEPHIAVLAREVRKCLENEEDIQTLEPGQWHLPFVSPASLGNHFNHDISSIKLSVARCASTSYKTVDGFDMTLDRAIALHDKLVAARPIHASPAEHVARADAYNPDRTQSWDSPEMHRNFVGFCQYRAMI